MHRGKSLLVSGAVARLVDPICRAEITRMGTADRGWGRLLDHLAAGRGIHHRACAGNLFY